MKALITGGSGYFGSLIIKKLLKSGFNVGSLDINEPEEIDKQVKFHQVDIRDYKKLKSAVSGYDYVFHNVAQVPLAKDNQLFWTVNVNGTENICKAALENNIKKLIYTSSSAVYGVPKKNPVNENTVPTPGEPYGIAKLEGERICKKYSEIGLKISIIRPRTIIGHGRLGIFSILFKWISEGAKIPVLDDGNNIYQFVHADDLAEACILASRYKGKFSTFNIGASDYTTMRKTLENLCDYSQTGSRVISLPMKPIEILMNVSSKLNLTPLAPYHSLMYGRSLYFDSEKSKKELGFTPLIKTNEMFQESYDWYLNNKDNPLYQKGSIHKKPVKESLLKIFRWFL